MLFNFPKDISKEGNKLDSTDCQLALATFAYIISFQTQNTLEVVTVPLFTDKKVKKFPRI